MTTVTELVHSWCVAGRQWFRHAWPPPEQHCFTMACMIVSQCHVVLLIDPPVVSGSPSSWAQLPVPQCNSPTTTACAYGSAGIAGRLEDDVSLSGGSLSSATLPVGSPQPVHCQAVSGFTPHAAGSPPSRAQRVHCALPRAARPVLPSPARRQVGLCGARLVMM